MTTLTIPANDHGQIRVFATDSPLPPSVLDKSPAGLQQLLGAALNPDFVDIVRIDDLGGMALTRYIAEGYDLAPDLVDAAVVDKISGFAVLVLSRASGGNPATLTLDLGLRHITTYSPTPSFTPHDPLPADSAKGSIPAPASTPPKSNARISGMVATIALIAMFLLVGLMIWIGG